VPELWPGLMHWLGSHHALRACGASFVALRAPPAFSSCHSLCTRSSAAGARRCRSHRRLCTCSSAACARTSCCRCSLYVRSSAAGARRGRCRRSLCTCSSVSGAHRAQGACGASWLQKDVAPELWPGLMHWFGSHHALRACRAFLVASPAFFSCPLRQLLGNPCGPTSYSAAYSRCAFLRFGASALAWCPCLCSVSLDRFAFVKGDYTTDRSVDYTPDR